MTLQEVYRSVKSTIDERLAHFEKFKSASNRELFIELCFCILTPQSRARSAWSCIESLLKDDTLFKGSAEEITPYLSRVRFGSRKALYIVEARKSFIEGSKSLKEILTSFSSNWERRDYLFKNVKGLGLKESSHFLRNVGYGEDIAILDRHIIRNLVDYKVIDSPPKSLTPKVYYHLEKKMGEFAKKEQISLAELDFVFWYRYTNDIFK